MGCLTRFAIPAWFPTGYSWMGACGMGPRRSRCRPLLLEALEDRLLFAAGASAAITILAPGPDPSTSAQIVSHPPDSSEDHTQPARQGHSALPAPAPLLPAAASVGAIGSASRRAHDGDAAGRDPDDDSDSDYHNQQLSDMLVNLLTPCSSEDPDSMAPCRTVMHAISPPLPPETSALLALVQGPIVPADSSPVARTSSLRPPSPQPDDGEVAAAPGRGGCGRCRDSGPARVGRGALLRIATAIGGPASCRKEAFLWQARCHWTCARSKRGWTPSSRN